jgi:hypothetical protein
LNAQEIVQFHRDKAVKSIVPFSDSALTLGAGIEHLVWQAAHPKNNGQPIPATLLHTLCGTCWPAASARDITETHSGVRLLPAQDDMFLLRAVESDLRARIGQSGFTTITAKALTGAVCEIINNVWQHAQAASPALLVYRLEHERVHIGVADMGVGVLHSLRTNSRYASLTTSMAALKKAMSVGVSRFDDGGHGYGFDTVLRAVADQWGAVRLRTGQAILEFHATTNLRHATASYGVDLPGLQIVFSCGVNPPATPITL